MCVCMYIYTCVLIMVLHTYLVLKTIGAGWCNKTLTRQAFASLPGQRFVEPIWFKTLFEPASLDKLAGSKIV